MTSPEVFQTKTLRQHPGGEGVMRILSAGIRAVAPGEAVRRFVSRKGQQLQIGGQAYDLSQIERVAVLGFGKAAMAMAEPLQEVLADRPLKGLLIPKQPAPPPWDGMAVSPGGHPLPDENSLRAGGLALELALSLQANDLLICLISGGGSALMSAPLPGIGLADLQALTQRLLACGARIDEINTLRRHLDQVKGGGLARAAAPARVASLILSDVVGSPLEAIASGPTAPDPTSIAQAWAVLDQYNLRAVVSPAIRAALEHSAETPKPGDALFARVQHVLVGSNALAEGYQPVFLGDTWQGEARMVAQALCRRLRAQPETNQPICLAAGGETTVTLRGSGRGGRNQELALAAVRELAGVSDVLLVTLATDGEDGPTDAAGALVTGATLARAQAMGLDPADFLADNNAYAFFEALGDLIKPGPTGTNVNDLTLLFRGCGSASSAAALA
jgi:hydroxypyruvate reductase